MMETGNETTIEYDSPHIKVTWKDNPENFTQEKIRRVKSYFQKKYKTKYIQIITKPNDVGDVNLQSADISGNISDFEYQKGLMKDFVSENKIKTKIDLLDRLDNKVNEEYLTRNGDKVKFNKWFIKKVEFSNFLSYGEGNVLEFDSLPGITVVESTPKNFGGKSTATVDLLMFLFFNKTTKTKTNIEVFNKFTDVDTVKVTGYITIDGDDYIIDRVSTRKLKRSGDDYTVTNKLEFSRVNPDGTKENLAGEQRRETETFISNAIGTEEDFLSTILTTGSNLEELINSKPTARGQILTKFLGLEMLKEKEVICKEIHNKWSKGLISNTHDKVQLEGTIEEYEEDIVESNEEITSLTTKMGESEVNLKDLEKRKDDSLSRRNNDIDQELIRLNPSQLNVDIERFTTERDKVKNTASEVEVVEPKSYYNEDDHNVLKSKMQEIIVTGKVNKGQIEKNESMIKQLEEGSICPTCKRDLEDVDHSGEITNLRKTNEGILVTQKENREKYDKLAKEEESFKTLKEDFDTYERNKLRKERYSLEIEQKQLDIDKLKGKLDNYEKNKQKLDDNQRIDGEILKLKTQIETETANTRVFTTNIEKLKNAILTLKEKIKTNNELIEKIKVENKAEATFKSYMSIFGKNGISKVILRNMVPVINQELYRLLVDSCHFILELNINERNEVEFNMVDTETRVVKPLNAGSGYEKTISSLALRSVITKISSLPKPNIVVMDEVFGKIADENLELVGEFFKKIKEYFDHIFVISHNPLIRNWSDNLVMVKKDENVSSIDFITEKI